MSFTLGVDMVLTGHSLGRNKLDRGGVMGLVGGRRGTGEGEGEGLGR